MDSNQRKCSRESKKTMIPKKMDIFPGMQQTTLPNGKKGWAEGYDLLYRTTGKESILDEPFLPIDSVIETNIDKISEWWFQILDTLEKIIIQECDINVSDELVISRACKMWFCGLRFLKENHPSYTLSACDSLTTKLADILEGENFWNYNPPRLVRHVLWCSSVELALREKIPVCPPYKEVPEPSVCDQDDAIHFVALASRGYTTQGVLSLINIMMAQNP
jgi:hypothetical protein